LKTNSAYSRDVRLAQFVSNSTYDKVKKDYGINVVIYGVPVGASFSDFHERAQKAASSSTTEISERQATNMEWTGLDPQASTVYALCANARLNEWGLHLMPVGATESDVTVKIKWTPQGKNAPQSVSVTWSGLGTGNIGLPTEITQGNTIATIPRPQSEQTIVIHYPGFDDSIVITPLPPRLTPASSPPPAVWKTITLSNQHDWIADWVNQTCAPNDASGITGSVKNTGVPRFDYTITVNCRVDNNSAFHWDRDPQTTSGDQPRAFIVIIQGYGGSTPIVLKRVSN
jgi:hypothetical protein